MLIQKYRYRENKANSNKPLRRISAARTTKRRWYEAVSFSRGAITYEPLFGLKLYVEAIVNESYHEIVAKLIEDKKAEKADKLG